MRKLAKAADRSPERVDVRRRYAIALFRRRAFVDAAREFGRCALNEPANARNYLFLARSLGAVGMADNAEKALRRAASLDPDHPKITQALRRLRRHRNVIVDVVPELALVSNVDAVEQSQSTAVERPRALPDETAAQADVTPRRTWSAAVVDSFDGFLRFLALEKAIAIRNMTIGSEERVIKSFTIVFKLWALILAHAYIYYIIGRVIPGGISYLSFNLSAFTTWTTLMVSMTMARPATERQVFNKNLNIRWINLIIADVVWAWLKIFIAFITLLVFFIVFPDRRIAQNLTVPNVGLFFYVFLLSAATGLGFGFALDVAKRKWEIIESITEIITWCLFFTSGMYEPYVGIPASVAQYYRLDPIMTITEFGRLSLDAGYPVRDLSLVYASACSVGILFIGLTLQRVQRIEDRKVPI